MRQTSVVGILMLLFSFSCKIRRDANIDSDLSGDRSNQETRVFANVCESVASVYWQTPATADKEAINHMGSGFVIHPAGYLLTNSHVVNKAENLKVVFDHVLVKGACIKKQSVFPAAIVIENVEHDLALIKIAKRAPGRPPTGFKAVTTAVQETIKIGETVLIVGNPLGLSGTLTSGKVSNKIDPTTNKNEFDFGRPTEQFLSDSFLLEAVVNPGNSGGPAFNIDGEVIGVVTAVIKNSGFGYAIKINTARKLIAGRLRECREMLWQDGLTVTRIFNEHREVDYLEITDVRKNSRAFNAGFQKGDQFAENAAQPMRDELDFELLMNMADVGVEHAFRVYRGREIPRMISMVAKPDAIRLPPVDDSFLQKGCRR